MHHRSRSRPRERPQRPDFGSAGAAVVPDCRGGHVQPRRRTIASKTAYYSSGSSGSSDEEDSFMQNASKRTSGVPIKRLIDDEVSKDLEIRHPSPSLVARLMGLDTLPPRQVVHKPEKNRDSHFHAASSEGFHESVLPSGRLRQKSTNYDKEFKDVFEVMETSNDRKLNKQPIRKELLSSKKNDADMTLIREKFMDVKRLSTDEALQNTKEFDDALEIPDTNKDLLLEFLQDPNSLFGKHLQDLNRGSSTPHPSEITVLKSSKCAKSGSSELWSKSEKNTRRCFHLQKEVISFSRKPETTATNHPVKKHGRALPHKSSELRHVHKTETHDHPTHIVVLKPSLEKAQRMVGDISLAYQKFHFGSRKYREFSISGIQELHTEGRERKKLADNVKYLGNKAKGSREIAREITRQMKDTVTRRSKNAITSELNSYNGSDRSCLLSDFQKFTNSEAFCLLPDDLDEWNNSFSPSSLYSTESSVSREARKRLSERWKMTRRFQEVGLVVRGTSTLGQMLALSDRETPSTTLDSLGISNVSNGKFARNEVLGTWGCPLGISSKDGWKDGSSRILPRSKSLPSSSTVHGSPKISNRRRTGGSNNYYMLKDVLNMGPDDFSDSNYGLVSSPLLKTSTYSTSKTRLVHNLGEENILPEREIHVNSEEPRKSIHVRRPSEEKPLHALADIVIADREDIIESASIPIYEDESGPSTCLEEQVKQFVLQVPSKSEASSDDNQNEETLTRHLVDPSPSQSQPVEQSYASCTKEVEQPSPVSVLEPPSEEESSSSVCFERISEDLQELRMQLKLLKLESADTYEEDMDVTISSDEACEGESCLAVPIAEMLQAFKNEDDRDFSYMLDILIDSGIHGANQDRLSDFCYSTCYPVDPHVFNTFENKYAEMPSWSRSERKLLFDLINSTLAVLVAQCMDLQPRMISRTSLPTWDRDGLVEGLWQMLAKQRKNLGSDPAEFLDQRWLGLEDDAKEIGKELERMLNDDLLEELVAEFIVV